MFTRNSAFPICRHTKTNGRRCQSPALTTSAFCHFHQKLRRTRRSTIAPSPALAPLKFPPSDADPILRALNAVLAGVAANQIKPAQAGKMLYALQLAGTDPRKSQ